MNTEEEQDGEADNIPRPKTRKKKGKREEDLQGLPVVTVEHSMDEKELEEYFGEDGWKELPDEVYRRYSFTPAKVEVEEHHVKVYAGKKTDEIIKGPASGNTAAGQPGVPVSGGGHNECQICQCGASLPQEQEFVRYGLNISRQNMANWTIQCADRYLAILYDYLHERLYDYHVLQADETPVLVNKDGRDAGSKSYMWVYRTGKCMGIARSSCMNTRRGAMQAIRGNSCGISAVFVLRTVTRYTTRSKMSVRT